MGKRKKSSRKPMGPKKSDPLPQIFNCLFCNHEKSVAVKLEKKTGVGNLECKVCGQRFSSAITYLSDAVDVYGDWVDAAELAAKNGEGPALGSLSTPGARAARRARDDVDADADDGYDSDAGREDREYAGEGIVHDEIED